MLLLTLILLPFCCSLLAAVMPANARNREAWLAGSAALAGLLIAFSLYGQIDQGEVLQQRWDWMADKGLSFSLRMDGLAWLFTCLIQGMCVLVVVYARYYMSPKDPVPRFFAFLLAFMGAMQGVVLSGNLVQLVMFWELTSLTSFLLIGYWHHRADARRGARMALTVTGLGGLGLLAGVMLLGHIVGSYDLDVVLASGAIVREHDWYLPTLILIALGALTKSAQFPFHFWLPHAMAAPTPVSTFLHSATMVKAGVFLLIRLWPVLSGTDAWYLIIGGAGVCTLLIGAFIAIFQHDIKGLLAYSTISHLGLITVLLGIGTPLAVVAAIFHTVNHATFKGSLFMAAGIIDHETGTRDMRKLRGLGKALPITSTLAVVASAAMAGVPLLNGFLSKEMFFAETLQVGAADNWWMSAAAVLAGVFSLAYSLRFIYIFFGPLARDLPLSPHEPPHFMRLPVELLVLGCLVVGIIPGLSIGPFLHMAVESVLSDRTPEYSLAVWHGFNLPLLMSSLALAGGVLLYVVLRRRFDLIGRDTVPLLGRFNGKEVYESSLLRATTLANRLERLLGTRRIQPQLLLMVVVGIAVSLPVLVGVWPLLLKTPGPVPPTFVALWVAGCTCAVAAAWQAKFHRLAALSLVGGTGVVTALTFLWLSAPDLALTQLMVETVTTVLILLGLRWLPARIEQDGVAEGRARLRRGRDLFVAVTSGVGVAALSYAVMMRPAGNGIGDFFLERALPEGGGSNVVNVLLVDFRGFDTLGEIAVLSIVALTVYALLRRFRPAPESVALPPQQTNPTDPAAAQTPSQQAHTGYLMVPGVYLRLLLPIIALVAAYFFMRGHNLPGGGFVAGLIFSVAIIVQYMLAGTSWVESRLQLRPYRWLAFGLLIAGAAGLGSLLVGYPFLTSHTAHATLPVLGDIHLPSAFVFDLGVFAVVVGSTMLVLVALAHQSVRSHRLPASADAAATAASRTTTTAKEAH